MGAVTVGMNQTVYVGLAVTSHNNSVLATDAFDNVTVTGAADTTPPIVSNVTASNITVNGANITWATDEPATSQVDYGITTSYGSSTALNTSLGTSHSQVVAGLQDSTTYHYRVRSTDAAGNATVSGDSTFVTPPAIDITPPSAPLNVTVQALSTTQAKVTWQASTDNVGVANYPVLRDGTAVGTITATNFTDAGLTPGQAYNYTVVANDAAGNVSAPSAPAGVTMPLPDTTPPTISLTAPAAGNTVSGTLQVSATASDNVGVAGVQFKLDGANLGSEVTTAPYQAPWNTTGIANGQHTLTAVARDAAGNTTTGSSVTVTVQNQPSILSVDTSASVDGHGTVTTSSFSTTQPGETLLAFASSDGASGSGKQTLTISGGGLTWTLVKRSNTQSGTSEIWMATATNSLSNVTFSSKQSSGTYDQSLTVVAFKGATGVGASAIANATTGTPTINLKTAKAGSLVFGVGNDWDNATARTLGSGQAIQHQWVDSSAGDTFWVQGISAATGAAGTTVTLNDTAPTKDRWNLAAVEVTAN